MCANSEGKQPRERREYLNTDGLIIIQKWPPAMSNGPPLVTYMHCAGIMSTAGMILILECAITLINAWNFRTPSTEKEHKQS